MDDSIAAMTSTTVDLILSGGVVGDLDAAERAIADESARNRSSATTRIENGLCLLAATLVAHAAPAGLAYSPAARLVRVHRRVRQPDGLALTFDDGPQPGATEHFLELLDRLGVRATFFVVGEQVERFPSLTREIVLAGHEVANHGYRHRNHLYRNPLDIMADLRRGGQAIAEVTGRRPDLFRPPHGVVTAATCLAAHRQESAVVLWTTWGRDWRRAATPDAITRDALSRAGGRGILLLHDADYYRVQTWHATYDSVPRIVEELRRRGVRVGPIGGRSALAW